MKIDWTASARTSCFHAAGAIFKRRKFADAALATALTNPTKRLAEIAARCGLAVESLFAELVPLSIAIEEDRRLVESAVARCTTELPTAALEALGESVAALQATFDGTNPRVADELELRKPVLREQWEAFGPGLMQAIGRTANFGSIAPQAVVVLVHPYLGGGGQAFAMHGVVAFEAVLANPLPELPEVVRLAWLLSQLNLETRRDPAAMIPTAVAAAADLGLAKCDHETLELARRNWQVVGG